MTEEHAEAVVLENLPFDIDQEKIIKQLRLHGDKQRFEKHVKELVEMVMPVANLKAIYTVGNISNKKEDSMEINSVIFTGSLLKVKLEKVNCVFPFVATCGREVDMIEIPVTEVLKRYCMDIIKMSLAFSAVTYLQNHIIKQHATGNLASLNPGLSETWPISQIKEVFSAIGSVESLIGVSLSQSHTMLPLKSRAGIFYCTD